MRRRWLIGLFLLGLIWVMAVAQYGGDEGYGGVQLHFSGRLTSAGSCQQLAQNRIQCQVPAGSPGTIKLTATVTPATYTVTIAAASSLPFWASFSPASGPGQAQAVCTFNPPAEAAGQTFQLVFRATTVYGLPVELIVELEVVGAQPPSGPGYTQPGYYTDEQGRFSVPVDYPPNIYVTGVLTRCTVTPLPGVPVQVTLLPKPDRLTIESLDDVGSVQISTPEGDATVTKFTLASSMDISGGVTRTIDVGLVCLPPEGPASPPSPPYTQPVEGTTDKDGKFSVPLQPGISVSGKLMVCDKSGKRPLPNQGFTLAPGGKFTYGPGGGISGFTASEFTISAPRYKPTTITKFSRVSLFGLTTYLLGDVCLHPKVGEEIGNQGGEGRKPAAPPCQGLKLRVLTQNMMLFHPSTPFVNCPYPWARAAELKKLLNPWNGAWGKTFDIICLQEVWHYTRSGNFDLKHTVMEGWLSLGGIGRFDLDRDANWHTLKSGGKDASIDVRGHKVLLLPRHPKKATKDVRVAIFEVFNRYVVIGPDSTHGVLGGSTVDSGLIILSQHPVIAASAFIFSKYAGVERFANKGVLYARVLLDRANPDCYIHVFNTHLQNKGQDTRAGQLQQLKEFIENCTRDPKTGKFDGHPIVLCGDFNIIAGEQEWKAQLQGFALAGTKFADAWIKSGKPAKSTKASATWVGNDQDTNGTPWGPKNVLATETGTFQRLDYILFFSGEALLKVKILSADREPSVARDKKYPWGGFTLSDHLGVKATFEVK